MFTINFIFTNNGPWHWCSMIITSILAVLNRIEFNRSFLMKSIIEIECAHTKHSYQVHRCHSIILKEELNFTLEISRPISFRNMNFFSVHHFITMNKQMYIVLNNISHFSFVHFTYTLKKHISERREYPHRNHYIVFLQFFFSFALYENG